MHAVPRRSARRVAGAILLVVVIGAGLAVHALLPDTAETDIAGDALYTAAVYLAVVIVGPRLSPLTVGGITAAWCVAVELFQLTGIPLALGAVFPPAMLALGTVFDGRDLLVYLVTAVVLVAADAVVSRARAGASRAESSGRDRRRARAWVIGGVIAIVVAGVVLTAFLVRPGEPSAAAPTPTRSVTATATPTPTPTPTGFPVNTTAYDVSALPQVNVFAVIPQLLVDDAPYAEPLAETAFAHGAGAPVWADPTGEPVAYLPRDYTYDGTTVPVVERQPNWVKVLLTGRQAVPSKGNAAQVTGWMRVADVELAPLDTVVEVSISERTVDIVRAGEAERIATDFAWGTDVTPTPLGRSYIMTTRVVPEFWYTRGHPIIYLSVQSPTLDGFGGADAAVTAFHYHDERSGPISNGCIRLDPDAIGKLAELPHGTPVIIRP